MATATAIRVALANVVGTLGFLLLTLTASNAQENSRNELGLLLGGTVTPAQEITGQTSDVKFGSGLTLQATYARQLAGRSGAAVYIEVPFLATPLVDISSSVPSVPANYASLFVTPGLRLKVSPNSRLSPWFSVGGGYALFEESRERQDGSPNPNPRNESRGAAQFGAGLDFRTPVKVLFPIGLRLEVRDLFSGKPNYSVNTGGGLQHNVVFSGGLVVKF